MIRASNLEDWDDEDWYKWDEFLKLKPPSAFLDSRSVKAALCVENRSLIAVCWLKDNNDVKGIAIVEDTVATSQSRGQFLKADKPFFKLAQTFLYRNEGVFSLNIRVIGSVLSSGDHAYRFDENVSEYERQTFLTEALNIKVGEDAVNSLPRTFMVKDHYSSAPWSERISGKSQWDKKWIDIEFDPVMEIDLSPDWKSLDEYSAALRKKSRAKLRRIDKDSSSLVLRELSFEEVVENADKLFELYSKVYGRAGFKLGMLHKEDLVFLKKYWKDDFPVIGYYSIDNELVGFQCGIVTDYSVEAFFVGFHLNANKTHSIYQRMLLEFIKQGIARGVVKISLGRTALDIKSSLGACPKRLVCHLKVNNRPIIHSLMRAVARSSSPKIPKLKRAWDDALTSPLSISSQSK
jgi:hypothetical protein